MILQPNQKIWLLATLITATSGKQLAAFYNTPNLQPRAQGYQPCLNFCGIGSSCSEACGDDYTTCPSSDSILHCFNPSASQICCPGGTGSRLWRLKAQDCELIVKRCLRCNILLRSRPKWEDILLSRCSYLHPVKTQAS